MPASTRPGGGPSTYCSARGAALACLNWAVETGDVDRPPLGKHGRGSHQRRERGFAAEALRRIREHVKPGFREYILALERTGARP